MSGMEGPPPATPTTAPKQRYAQSGGIQTKSRIYFRICVPERYAAPAQQATSVAPNRQDQLLAPPSPLCSGYWGSFTQVKQPGRESDHSAPSSAEVKNEWSYTSTPLTCLHGLGSDLTYIQTFSLRYLFIP